MPQLDVDHIIAAHDLRRPIARGVASVLEGTRCRVRVTVVCHNVEVAAVADALGALAQDSRLRLIPLPDGVPSPSGPFNAGLDAATARFTSIMGSDDELESGALDSWLACADHTGSDVVIPRLRVQGRGPTLTPPVRLGRTRGLDGVRDRLAYRTAPLGLVSRAAFGQVRMPAGLRSGEDVEYSAQLWFSGSRIAFDHSGPAYVVNEDAPVRVSTVRKPLAQDAAFVTPLLDSDVFRGLHRAQRDALVTKLLRGNLLGWLGNRPVVELWSEDDRRVLQEVLHQLVDVAPRALALLSRTDRRILDAISATPVELEEALALVATRTALRPSNLVTRHVGTLLAREAPIRFGIGSRALGFSTRR